MDVQVKIVQEMTLSYKLLSIAWINSRTIFCIDTQEVAHVIDVRSEEELEVLDLTDVGLVHGAAFYKSFASGDGLKTTTPGRQNPSYHSVVSFNGQIFLLGSASVQVFSVRSWSDRLAVLTCRKRYPEALSLARSFLDGTAKTVIGLSGSAQERRQAILKRVVEILVEYVDFVMSQLKGVHQMSADQTKLCQVYAFFICVLHGDDTSQCLTHGTYSQ